MVRHLLLMRQGKPNKKLIPIGPKGQAPLAISDKSKRNAQRMGIWLAKNSFEPDEVLTSSDECSWVCAEKSLKAMGKNIQSIRIVDSSLFDSNKKLIATLNSLSKNVSCTLLVGEGKKLDSLIRSLTKESATHFVDESKILKANSVAVFSFNSGWDDLNAKNVTLERIVHRHELDRQFPYPDLHGNELRDRPAYYYTQSAVIPYRLKKKECQILLISSSKKNHWLVPKGILEPGLSAEESAAKEAYEEAGIEGIVENPQLGSFKYEKWGAPCEVTVFPMCVVNELDEKNWPESHRKRKWCSVNEAKKLVKQSMLKPLIDVLQNRVER